jgi:hypothetical protein
VNQNAEPGWAVEQPTGARLVSRPDGRLGVQVPASASGAQVVLCYTPPWLRAGLWVFLFAAPGLALYASRSS